MVLGYGGDAGEEGIGHRRAKGREGRGSRVGHMRGGVACGGWHARASAGSHERRTRAGVALALLLFCTLPPPSSPPQVFLVSHLYVQRSGGRVLGQLAAGIDKGGCAHVLLGELVDHTQQLPQQALQLRLCRVELVHCPRGTNEARTHTR